MPWKLIGILIILSLFVIFSGYNAHEITIYFGPFTLFDIPLFVALVTTFILGAFTALPFSIIKSVKNLKKKEKKQEIDKTYQKSDVTKEQPLLPGKEENKKNKKSKEK